jgi:hypothetical protein
VLLPQSTGLRGICEHESTCSIVVLQRVAQGGDNRFAVVGGLGFYVRQSSIFRF